MAKKTAFDAFVADIDAKFEKMEKLLTEKSPSQVENQDFKLLQENYDAKFEGVSGELTSLKELLTGVTDKIDKHRTPDQDLFMDLFLGF